MKLFEIRRYYFYKVNKPSKFIFFNNKLDVRIVSLENYRDICNYSHKLSPVFLSFLQQGNKGLYGYIDGKLVAYAWSILNKGEKTKRVRGFFPLKGNAACVHYCRVFDKYQGMKIYQTMLSHLYCDLYGEVDAIFLDTEITNIPAQRAIEKSWGEKQGKLVSVVILGKTVITFKCLKS